MNERIRELAEQAREFATTRHPVSNIVLSVNSEKFEEKFAELIVQECIEVANKNRTVMEIKTNTHLTADAIKEHFGVEE
jgi:hypothetical protein